MLPVNNAVGSGSIPDKSWSKNENNTEWFLELPACMHEMITLILALYQIPHCLVEW